MSKEAKDLVLRLCRGPEDRLGAHGADEIKKHRFFLNNGDVHFESLRRSTAPYIPVIRNATDTSNFDPVDPDKLRSDSSVVSKKGGVLSPSGTANGKSPQHAFFEFTFRRFFDEGGQLITKPTQEYFDSEANSEISEQLSKSTDEYCEGDTGSEHSLNNKESNAPVYV